MTMNQTSAPKGQANELAKERNHLASDRTLMAWIRTAISLFGFGFAIAKSYEYIEKDYAEKTGRVLEAIPTPIIFGVSFIILGMIGILAGAIQYRNQLKLIKEDRFLYTETMPMPQITAFILLIIGAFGIAAIFL